MSRTLYKRRDGGLLPREADGWILVIFTALFVFFYLSLVIDLRLALLAGLGREVGLCLLRFHDLD